MAKKEETNIQNSIRIALSQNGCIVFRDNVGKFYTMDGRFISIGTTGQSDLRGHRKNDGKAFYIETKTPIGKATTEQKNFIEQMQKNGALAGFARSVDDALKIIEKK